MYNSIYPAYVKYYPGINNNQITKKQNEEKNSQSSQTAENDLQEKRKNKQEISTSQNYFPNGEKVAIDYTRRKINIDQVLSDFKNTANAIGTPDDIKSEVNSYLELVKNQSKKDKPNQQIIQSNLKSASQILDEYITNTLKKPSKVVENWVDALFLQQIDYKSIATEKKQEISESVPNDIISPETVEATDNISYTDSRSDIYIPKDPHLKSMFIQAKKYSLTNNNEKALNAFENVLDYADEIGDSQIGALAHYEKARIYDKTNCIEDALYSYNRAAHQTQDNNIKAKSHLYMGKIYDDFVKFEPAIEHYCAAVSFSGEADNLKLQTMVLTDLTLIHTDRYDKENAYMFMGLADIMADETKNNKLKARVFSKNAKCCEKLNDNNKALKYWCKSSEAYSKEEDVEHLAQNYTKAADIMLEYGNKAKAKTLLSKAYSLLQNCDNPELKQEVINRITTI